MQRLLMCLLVVAGGALVAGSARAQSSPVSELWRQWAVLEQAWRAEKAEVEVDRARLRARRAERRPAGEAPPDGSSDRPSARPKKRGE